MRLPSSDSVVSSQLGLLHSNNSQILLVIAFDLHEMCGIAVLILTL